MKKPLSNMTAPDFIESMGALGLTYSGFARALSKAPSTITNYASGKRRVPVEVFQRITELIRGKQKQLAMVLHTQEAALGEMIVYHNQVRRQKPELHRTEGRFMGRQLPPDTRTFPAYRMTAQKMGVYLSALAAWKARVRELARTHGDAARQRDYQLELADIEAMGSCVPRHAPYEIVIQRNEWMVVARALLHMDKSNPHDGRARALYQHWRKHKGCGYPVHMMRERERSRAA